MITVTIPKDLFELPSPDEVRGQTIALGDEVSFFMSLWKMGGARFDGVVTRVASDHDAVGVRAMTEGGRDILFIVPARVLRRRVKREDAA